MFPFLIPPFIVGVLIGHRWVLPVATIGWPLLYLLDSERGEFGPLILLYVVTGALGSAVGVWFRRAIHEETIGSKEQWSSWWHEREWRQH
ncbi:MAG: hypothetical protein IT336_01210 [Thermomicrobiales bacterium]|nr:hypothetical protein [Thermomicrobiales bacterium]